MSLWLWVLILVGALGLGLGLHLGRKLGGGVYVPPFPTVPTFNDMAFTGDSITVPSLSYANAYDAARPDKNIIIVAANSRVIGTLADLNNGGNSLMGNVATAMAGGSTDLVGGQIGANDLAVSTTPSQYFDRLAALYTQYKAVNPSVKVIWCAPYPYNDNQGHPNYANFMASRATVISQARDPSVWSLFCDYPCFFADHPAFAIAPNGAFYSDEVHIGPTGYQQSNPGFFAFMDTILDPLRASSTALYNSAWPANESGLDQSTQYTRYLVVSGLSPTGAEAAVSVSGASGQIALNGGSFGASINQRLYNGDIIAIRFTTSANSDTPVTVSLTFNGETRGIVYRTAVASVYTARFDPARKSAQGQFFDSNRSFSSGAFGSQYPATGGGDTVPTYPVVYAEFTWNKSANSYAGANIGLIDDSFPFGNAGTLVSGQAGCIGFSAAGVYRIAGGSFVTAPTWEEGTGPRTVGLLYHIASGRVWFRDNDGTFFPDTPTFNANGTIASGTGILTGLNLAQVRTAVMSADESKITGNWGQTPFALGALPANVDPGWR